MAEYTQNKEYEVSVEQGYNKGTWRPAQYLASIGEQHYFLITREDGTQYVESRKRHCIREKQEEYEIWTIGFKYPSGNVQFFAIVKDQRSHYSNVSDWAHILKRGSDEIQLIFMEQRKVRSNQP